MRQAHPGGRAAVRRLRRPDGPGDRRPTGEVAPAQIFVAVLGASNYTYAEATWTQTLPDWIGAHATRARLPRRRAAPDRARQPQGRRRPSATGTSRGSTATYPDLAAHYGTAILPARTRKPRDKAKVEVGVLVVERWILARLRNRRFFSLAELNAADRRAGRRPQRAADAPPRRQPRRAVRRARPPGAQAACRPSPTSTPSGACAASRSTTTSTSRATTTPCRTASSASRSRRA